MIENAIALVAIILLIALGESYALRKYYRRKAKKNERKEKK